MKTRWHTTRVVALLVFLVLLAFVAFHSDGLTADQSVSEAVAEFLAAGSRPLPDGYAIVACLALVALFGYVAWDVLRADEGEDEAKPPPGNGARSASR
jgi:hypothetical protein